MLLMITALIFFAYSYQTRMRKKQQEVREIQNLLKSEELHSAYALLEGQDSERQRIANDLHDRMGGQLSTVKIYLDLLEGSELGAEQKELIEKLQRSVLFSIEEIRAIAHDLNNTSLRYFGLQKAIEQLCETIQASKKVKIEYNIVMGHKLSSPLIRDVYQIIQELFTNTLRHANASQIHLEVNALKGELNLIYQDNGVGFDPSAVRHGIGLESMQLRAGRYEGTVFIDSRPGKGVNFVLEIPLSDEKI